MEIKDFLTLYSSFINTTISNNPVDFTSESLSEVIVTIVGQLKAVRLDNDATCRIINEMLKKYQKPRKTPDGYIAHYEDTVESNILSFCLLKYIKREPSYYYAYIRLEQELNGRFIFKEDIIFRTEIEIEEEVLRALKEEALIVENGKSNKKAIQCFKDIFISEDLYNKTIQWLEAKCFMRNGLFVLNARYTTLLFLTLQRFGYAKQLNIYEREQITNEIGAKYSKSSFALFDKKVYTEEELTNPNINIFFDLPIYVWP